MYSLFEFLDAVTLGKTSTVSRAWYIFCYHDEFWRKLVLEQHKSGFIAQPTWRRSYIATIARTALAHQHRHLHHHHKLNHEDVSPSPVQVQGFYSDLLFQPFYCAQSPASLLSRSSLDIQTVPRLDGTTLSARDFKFRFETPNQPVILTNVVTSWPAMEKWTDAYLNNVCSTSTFYAGGLSMTMAQYMAYARTLQDDQPLFFFDKNFATTVPALAEDYTVPPFFDEDLFRLLDDERPDYRWLIFGPAGSGSSFHIDPNATSAWNAVIRGAKKWILFPPEYVPPGVHPSVDGGDVATPISLMEWFVTFYPQIHKGYSSSSKPSSVHLEGTCRAGEVIFVPRGWWHIVLNVEESLAITQNFVSISNVMVCSIRDSQSMNLMHFIAVITLKIS